MRREKLEALRRWLADAAREAYPELADCEVELELPRDPSHGDIACNLALKQAGRLGRPPREAAERIAGARPWPPELVERPSVAGPGFINFSWSARCLRDELAHILGTGEDYGRWGGSRRGRVQLEFVSANPTGPLNVVSARAAAVGDSLAQLMRLGGYDVETEFYVNDHGTQVGSLGESLRAFFDAAWRGRELPEELPYGGAYLEEIAGRLLGFVRLAARLEGEAAGLAAALSAGPGGEGRLAAFLRARGEEDASRALVAFVVSRYRAVSEAPAPSELRRELTEALRGAALSSSVDQARQDGCAELLRRELDFGAFAVAANLEGMETDLGDFGVTFDSATGRGTAGWFRESWLHGEGAVEETERELDRGDFLRREDGASWLVTSRYGDTEDRVVRRRTGESTYFLTDIAYHRDKRRRDYDRVIDIWGPDHHSHVARMQAALRMQGCPEGWLHVLIAQQVNLLRDGRPVKMSKRAGEFVTLRDLLSEVGRDVCRFYFLMRRISSPLEFDLTAARQESEENPIYYIEYAYARIRSIFHVARQRDISLGELGGAADLERLTEPEELELMKQLGRFPSLVESCTRALDPHGMGVYLRELAKAYHRSYHRHRVLVEEEALRRARLALTEAVRVVLGNGLRAVGVEPPSARM